MHLRKVEVISSMFVNRKIGEELEKEMVRSPGQWLPILLQGQNLHEGKEGD